MSCRPLYMKSRMVQKWKCLCAKTSIGKCSFGSNCQIKAL